MKRHLNFHRLILALLLFCPFVAGWAVSVTSLYRVMVPVASQLEDQRGLAESDGFLQVLVKLTGDPDIAKNPVIKGSQYRAEYFVHDYSYSPPSPASSEYMMKIQYDHDDIVRLLKKASVPFWHDSRPLTLAWLTVTDNRHQTDIISTDSSTDIHDLIKAQSRKLGIALIFPVMDMDEINQIDAKLIMDVALPELKQASKRYSPDVLLIGQIDETPDQVTGKWNLVMNANQWDWNVSGKTMQEMIASAMTQISQTMIRQYAADVDGKANHEYWLKVIVTNVNGNAELGRVIQFFNRLAPVDKLQLSEVSGDRIEVYLLIGGTIDGFQKNAAVGQRLLLKASDQTAKKLTYQWVR